jgi:hypothetical protein
MLASLAAAGALAVATAQAHDNDDGPLAQTLAPSDVTNTSATLHGTVDADRRQTTYWFDIGPTTAYGAHTQAATTDKKDPVDVQSTVSGLTKGAVYHVRLVALNSHGLSLGADLTFTASAPVAPTLAPPLPAAPPATAGPSGAPNAGAGSARPLAPAAPPELGESIGVDEQAGSVLVRVPGSPRPVPVTDAASVPVGSIVDARKGTVALSSALPGDARQTGTFHGGIFQVRQPTGARGMIELVLRGPLPVCKGGGARAAAASAKRPPRALWGRDDHGRFRTRGSNSVATVRGTAWYVEDRCDGTLTRVSKGSVSVRDLHRQRTVMVNAGKSYLARPAKTR